MNSPADVDNDLPMNNDDQVLEPVAVEMDDPINQLNEPQLVSLQPVNDDDTEMEVSQLVNLQPIDPSQHDSEMEDNNQIQQLTNLEVNREEDEEDESNLFDLNKRIKSERIDSDEEFVNLGESSNSNEDLRQQSSNNRNDDEEFVNLDENTEPLSSDNQDEEFVNLEGSTEILDLDRNNTVTYSLDQTTTSIDVDQNSRIINLDHTTATISLDQTHATIDLNESSEILDLDRHTVTYNLDQTHGTIDLNTTTSSKLPDYEDDDVKPNIELLSLQQKIAYLEEPMSDEEDVKPNIEELNLAFNINHLDHLDINQTSNDAKPQKSNKTSKSKSKSKSAPAEPINSAQVIQIIENDQVVQIINMEEVAQASTSTIPENDDKIIQVTNVEQVIENNQVVHVLNMDESISTDSDQQTENTAPNQPIVINIPPISSQPSSSSQRSPTLSQSSQSNSANTLKRKNITEKQKHLIEFLHLENGLTAEQIRNHDKLRREDGSRILLKTIKYWLDRLKKTGEMQTKHRSGRPRFLDSEKERQLLEYIDSHTKKNYHMVKIEKQLQCTRRTINNYALRNGIKAYRALKKPSLNDFQKKRRLLFCEEWLQRFDDCQKIIFTDEKLFNGQPTNTYQLVRRRKGERFLEENISHTIRPQPKTSTNIWVYIGPFGKGEIFLAENDEYFDDDGNKIKKAKHGTTSFFNAISYRNMLEKRAIPSIKERIDDFIFQQDNASIHCAKNESKTDTLVGELLKRENITTMYWPPLSPDLNPVENVHHLLQVELNKELTTLDIKPKNKADVFALCKECWERVDNNVVKKIYFSFYSRLEKVKERNGANNY